MTGILYFSSTGNSLYIAQQIAGKIDSQIKYIPAYSSDGSEFDRLIIVSPIYSYGLPVHVYDIIPQLSKSVPVYIVLNYGGMVSGADWLTYCHAKDSGLDVRGVYTIQMPENFTLTFTVPGYWIKRILRKCPADIEKVTKEILSGETHIPKKKKTKADVYLKNKSNWHLIADDFSTTDDCTLCGKCVSLCPVGNISIADGKIAFDDKCVACLGCYHRCPAKAIRYKDKTKKLRYINPNINETDIGRDL